MGYKLWGFEEVLASADVNAYLMKQAVISCTSGTRPSSPQDGMMIYETDTRFFRSWNSSDSSWNFVATNRKLWCRKGTDTGRASNTTPSADPDLLIPNVPASTYYRLNAVVGYFADTTADMKGGLYGPSGASYAGTYQAPPSSATGTSGSMTYDFASFGTGFIFGGTGTGNNIAAEFNGVLYSGTGGTVGFTWAQSVSSGTATTVLTSSYITLFPIA